MVKALCLGGLTTIMTISAVRNGEGSNPSALSFSFAFWMPFSHSFVLESARYYGFQVNRTVEAIIRHLVRIFEELITKSGGHALEGLCLVKITSLFHWISHILVFTFRWLLLCFAFCCCYECLHCCN